MANEKTTVELPSPVGFRIVGIEVENYMRVKTAKLRPKSNIVIVGGKNGQGKTSLLSAIDCTIAGTSALPSKPIRVGAGYSKITIDLGDFIVERHIKKVDSEKSKDKKDHIAQLKIIGKNRETYPSPQRLLDGFMGAFTFDPLAFTRLEGPKQVEALRRVVTFAVDIDQLEADRQQAYDERRLKSRELESAKARVATIPAPSEHLPLEMLDLTQYRDRMVAANLQIAEHQRRVESQKQLLREAEECERAADLRRKAIESLRDEITELERGVAEYTEKRVAASQAAAQVEIPERPNVEALMADYGEAQTLNMEIGNAQRYREAQSEVERLQEAFYGLDETVKLKAQEREKAIAEAQMPIEGIGVSQDGSEVLYNGIPFGQASTAEQVRVSAAMAMALSPRLRVMRIMDGSLLDDESMAILERMAKDHDYQVWIERVGGNGEVGIVMEDGEAKGLGVVA